MVRTTLDIDEKWLKEAMEVTKAKTKREVVNRSLEELVMKARREELIAMMGKMEGLTHRELMQMRSENMIGRHWPDP